MGKILRGKKHRKIWKKAPRGKKLLALTLTFIIVLAIAYTPAKQAISAFCCPNITRCNMSQCTISVSIIRDDFHPPAEQRMFENTMTEFRIHRYWFTKMFLKEKIVPVLQIMAETLSYTIHHHAAATGKLFDAKHQLETQRLMQKLAFDASKRYQPSESFCWFGTGVRSLHSAEAKEQDTIKKNNTIDMTTQLGTAKTALAGSTSNAQKVRWDNFTSTYCRLEDNNNGLTEACGSAGARPNKDLAYNELINTPHTIDADFSETNPSDSAKDILALKKNLYGSRTPTKQINTIADADTLEDFMRLRSIMAKRNVAQSSFNAILGLKSKGEEPPTLSNLQAILTGLGTDNATTFAIGEKPSYYAQLELLAKRIYQNPHFYAGLYESPENIERKAAALKTIELMLERAIAESETRQEMMMSVLLTSKLNATILEAGIMNK